MADANSTESVMYYQWYHTVHRQLLLKKTSFLVATSLISHLAPVVLLD